MFPLVSIAGSIIVPMSFGGVSTYALVQLLCCVLYILCIMGIVSFNEVYPRSFVWVQPSVFVYVFVLGVLKKPIAPVSKILYTSMTIANFRSLLQRKIHYKF